MKHMTSGLILLCIHSSALSQTIDDYKHVMNKWVEFYNIGEVDSMNNLCSFPPSGYEGEMLHSSKIDFGNIKSFSFMVIDSMDKDVHGRPMAYFKANCTKVYWEQKHKL